MALYKQTSSQLPPGAIQLNREEAVSYQLSAIDRHFPQYETLFLKYGYMAMGLAACTSGFWIQHYFRKQFLLKSEGFFTNMLPSCFLPGIMATFWHSEYTLVPIILQEEKCPLCTQAKAGIVLATSGVVFPLILSPLGAIMSAIRYKTFYIPSKYKDVFKLVVSTAKPGFSKMVTIGLVQFVVGVGFTAEEQREFYYMQKRRELRQDQKKIVHQ